MGCNYALSAYPLSQKFQTELEHKVGEPIHFLLLQDLRGMPYKKMWRFIRDLKPKQFFLPVEDQNGQVLLPILQLIAQISFPKQLFVVTQEFIFRPVSMYQIIKSSLSMLTHSFMGYAAMKYTCIAMKKMEKNINKNRSLSINLNEMLYINANFWFGVKAGGSVGHISGVVNAIHQEGIRVNYAALDKSTSILNEVNYIHMPPPKTIAVPAEINFYPFIWKSARFLLKEAARYDWKMIYQRISVANFTGVILAKKLKIPLVIEYNGSETWVSKNWGKPLRYHQAAERAENLCLQHADLIVTISTVLKDELLSRGISQHKILCYPNGIDPTLFNPNRYSIEDRTQLRAKHHIPAEAVLCTFVGTFGQWHGVDILAKAIKNLFEKNKKWIQEKQVYFLLVGDGMKMSEVKEILKNELSSPHLKLIGIVPQLEAPAYLAASDILLSPHVQNIDGSRFFGSPTKLFEYMAMGKGIIASDLDQIGEVLKISLKADNLPLENPQPHHKELSILCEPGNITQLIQGLEFLVENKPWRQQIGKNAREEALNKYTWQHHIKMILEQFRPSYES